MKKLIFPILIIATMVMTGCTSQNDTSKEVTVDLLPLTQETSPAQEETNKKANTDLLPPSQEITSAQGEINENPPPPVQESTVGQYELSELEHVYVTIDGMSCPSCAIGIEYSLKDLGVTDASISPLGTGEIIYNPAIITESDLKTAAEPYIITIVKTEPATSYSLN